MKKEYSAKRYIRLILEKIFGPARLMKSLAAKTRLDNRNENSLSCDADSPKIVIVGCPDYGNLGDHAIAFAEEVFVKTQCNLAVVMQYGPLRTKWRELVECIQPGDTICLQGGGNMGTLYESYENERLAVIDRFRNNKIILFPQTISYGESLYERCYVKHMAKVYGCHSDLHLVAREQMSFERMRKLFPKAEVVLAPDIVLSLPMFNGSGANDREGLYFCLRADKECVLGEDTENVLITAAGGRFGGVVRTDTMYDKNELSPEEGKAAVLDKIAELSRARLVVTDRIHGMIFCALSGTPCIALDNSNGKVGQEFRWLEHLPFMHFAHNVEEAVKIIQSSAIDPGKFSVEEFAPLFEPLAKLFR